MRNEASLRRFGSLEVEIGQCTKLLKTVAIVRMQSVTEVFDHLDTLPLIRNSMSNRGSGVWELLGE